MIDTEWRHAVFMIAKEMINNSVKYSEADLISVKIALKDNNFFLTVKDNGKGFDKNKVIQGNGLVNMQERAAEISATLHIQSENLVGTTIELFSRITQCGRSHLKKINQFY